MRKRLVIGALACGFAGGFAPLPCALHPSQRYGYVDGPDPGVTQIQGFIY